MKTKSGFWFEFHNQNRLILGLDLGFHTQTHIFWGVNAWIHGSDFRIIS